MRASPTTRSASRIGPRSSRASGAVRHPPDRASGSSILKAAQVPCGPINDIAQAFAERRCATAACAWICRMRSGRVAPGVRNPARFSRSALEYPRRRRLLGAAHRGGARASAWDSTAAELAQLRGCGALGKVPRMSEQVRVATAAGRMRAAPQPSREAQRHHLCHVRGAAAGADRRAGGRGGARGAR